MASMFHIAASIIRALPSFRGRGRLSVAVSRTCIRAGANPIVRCKMRLGHSLYLDCRLPSHCYAYFSGQYDDAKVRLLTSFLRSGGTALDVGANIGLYCVPLALAAKTMRARVVAVEPVPENLECLRRNLSLNLCGDVVHIVELALADQPDIGQM